MALTDKLTSIANAIRTKDGSTGTMTLAQMPEKILAIQSDFTTEEATVSPKESIQTVTPSAADALSKVTVNAIPSNYVGSSITSKTYGTITPTTTDIILPSKIYLGQETKIKGDANLVSSNIKKDVSIFNVKGTYEEPLFAFGGLNATKISEYKDTYTLADTSFVKGSSASTSSTSIKATVSNVYTSSTGSPTIAYGNKDIVVIQRCHCIPIHSDSATKKALQTDFALVHVTWFSKRKSTETSTSKTIRQSYLTSCVMNSYYNTSGVLTRGVTNYGFYMSPQTPNVYSTSATSTYVRCSSPILYYRASSSYESTANIKLVEECYFDWTLEVYSVDPYSTVVATINDELDDILINGLIDHNVNKISVEFPDGTTEQVSITDEIINYARNDPQDCINIFSDYLSAGSWSSEEEAISSIENSTNDEPPWVMVIYGNQYSQPDADLTYVFNSDGEGRVTLIDTTTGNEYFVYDTNGANVMINQKVDYSAEYFLALE